MSVVGTTIRPPYIRFVQRAVEDRSKEIAKGKYEYRNVDIVLLTVPGQKDTTERYAEDWLADSRRNAEDGRIPAEWPELFEKAYDRWKKGEALPETGTAIKGWSLLSPAAQEVVIQAGVRTVEDLAAISDEAAGRIGIGAVTFKQKAAAWLKEANEKGTVAAENATLHRDLASANEKITQQAEMLKELAAKVAALAPKTF